VAVNSATQRLPSSNFCEFCFPPESHPADPSPRTSARSSSLGLPLPSALVRIAGPHCGRLATPTYVPPSGFGYPPSDFLPAIPSKFCFALTALLGLVPSKLRHSAGHAGVTTEVSPHVVSSTVDADLRPHGPVDCDSWVLTRPKARVLRLVLAAWDSEAPLGFAFLR